MHITDFNALPKLTRFETLQREAILYALKRFPARFCNIRGDRSKAAAWLGISRSTLKLKLKFYELSGNPIEAKEFKKKHYITKKASPNIKSLLMHLGVPIIYETRKTSFWSLPSETLFQMLETANRNRLNLLKKEHPDIGGNPERTKEINNAWSNIKRLFGKRNIIL